MPELVLRQRHPRRHVNLPLLRRIAAAAQAELARLHPTPAHAPGYLGVHLVDTPTIARLNQRHLGHPGPTDVITFHYPPLPGADPAVAAAGADIFICLDEAARQARAFRTSWPRELVRYLVHGLLHCHGYDDQTPATRRPMKRLEDRCLRHLTAGFPLSQLASRNILRP